MSYYKYYPPRLPDGLLQGCMDTLLSDITWEQHDPHRKEAMFSRTGHPYQYGEGRGFRRQYPQDEPPPLAGLWAYVEAMTHCPYEVCFVNVYLSEDSSIGWHYDNSPSIDASRPVSILSLGAEREVSFRKANTPETAEHIIPEAGSVLSMLVGTNAEYEHAVLPVIEHVGLRMSLVFRGSAPYVGDLVTDYLKYGVVEPAGGSTND